MEQKKQKFSFLCGTYDKKNYIYAIKHAMRPWHYFQEPDSVSSEHGSLPALMDLLISRLDKVKSIDLNLNEDQYRNYYENGSFAFKGKELKTCKFRYKILSFWFAKEGDKTLFTIDMELENKTKTEPTKSKSIPDKNNTNRLLFVSGETDPLLFLNEFEKCHDVKTDKDKMYKIRNFVDEIHKADFTKLYFHSNWSTVRSSFLKAYSLSFAKNKKIELQIDFNKSATLRSFVERKLMSLDKFTTLPFNNQVEMVMNDLPPEISSLFTVKEMTTGNKAEILDFCDSIQELVGTMEETEQDNQRLNDLSNEPLKRMEVFNFNPEFEQSDAMLGNDEPGPSSGRRGLATAKRGRPSKKLKTIPEFSESSDYEFLNEMDNCSSRSSWSS